MFPRLTWFALSLSLSLSLSFSPPTSGTSTNFKNDKVELRMAADTKELLEQWTADLEANMNNLRAWGAGESCSPLGDLSRS